MYRNIVVPLDGSAFAEQAIPTAAALSNAMGSILTLVRVHEMATYDFGNRDDTDRLLLEAENRYLCDVAGQVWRDYRIHVSTDVPTGHAVDEICSMASRSGDSLIVMSTHGRTGLSRSWLGSTADGVLHHATTPVLMLRASEDLHNTAAGWPLPFRTIVVPLDGTPFSEQVLAHAAAVAAASSAKLVLMHVVAPVIPAPPDFPIPYMPPSEILGEATEALVERSKQYTKRLTNALHGSRTGLDVDSEIVVDDNVARVIIDTSERKNADLVAMATHARGLSRLVIASVADKVVRGGPGAVLLIRPQHD
jgi:nucleotide-binding universal stress UspA family protein